MLYLKLNQKKEIEINTDTYIQIIINHDENYYSISSKKVNNNLYLDIIFKNDITLKEFLKNYGNFDLIY